MQEVDVDDDDDDDDSMDNETTEGDDQVLYSVFTKNTWAFITNLVP